MADGRHKGDSVFYGGMGMKTYFHRVQEQTPTRFWINNVTREEAKAAIVAGARGCTQNPSYSLRILEDPNEKEHAYAILDKILANECDDNEVLIKLQKELIAEIAEIFMPVYEESGGRDGYVSIQGDPFREDTETLVRNAQFNRGACPPNIMAKIPVTEEGLVAIVELASEGVPINATEVMAVRQALDVGESYLRVVRKINNPAPLYYSHIPGIYDEYLQKYTGENGIEISYDAFWQAGVSISKKIYQIMRERAYPVGFIAGGARGLHHFTEMVGAECCVTINWKGTADTLIESNPPVVQRFLQPTPLSVVDELMEKLDDYRKSYMVNAIIAHEYEDFGPVAYFRNIFEGSWTKALEIVKERRSRK